MPGGDGSDWLPRILKEYPDVAIIMITGGGSEQVAAQVMREGAMDYLVKGDISTADMERALLNALEKMELRKTIAAQQRTSPLSSSSIQVTSDQLLTNPARRAVRALFRRPAQRRGHSCRVRLRS